MWTVSLAMVSTSLLLATLAEPRKVVNLWPTGNPGGWSRPDKEVTETDQANHFRLVKNVSDPTLEIFPSAHPVPNAPVIVICPGGGYWVEAIEHEGWEIAERFNKQGIHAAVLKYRLPNRNGTEDKPLWKAPLEDSQRAISLARQSPEWFGGKVGKVGILGFSAGGHLSAITSTTTSRTYAPTSTEASQVQPDFALLIYPAYLDPESNGKLAPEFAVDGKTTPPTWIFQTSDDPYGASSLTYAAALRSAKVPVELHLFPHGGHGYGARATAQGLATWPEVAAEWVKAQAK